MNVWMLGVAMGEELKMKLPGLGGVWMMTPELASHTISVCCEIRSTNNLRTHNV